MAADGSDSDLWVHGAFEARLRSRVRELVTPELIAEHASDPRDPSDSLTRVLEYLRRAPMAGKYVVVAAEWFSDYRIGVLSGGPGTPVAVGEASFESPRRAYHEIFLMRLRELGVEWV